MATRTRAPARRPPHDQQARRGRAGGGSNGAGRGGGERTPGSGGSRDGSGRRRPADGRRRLPAGYAFLIILIALAFAALLNAQGMHKTATIQDDGLGRDIAVPLTGALADVSHFLYIDRLRAGLKSAIGRGEDDEILDGGVTFASSGDAGAPARRPASKAPPKPPPKPVFTPADKARVWIAGDSLSVVPGMALFESDPESRAIEQVGEIDGQIATGLTRPDLFNWFEHIPGELKRLDPDVVVLTFGANDDKAFMTGIEDGVELDDFGEPKWEREYRRRVGGVMDEVIAGGRSLVWVGLPVVRDAGLNERFKVLNRIYKSEAEKRPYRVAFVDAYEPFVGPNGGYADYLKVGGGAPQKVRMDDGVHYEHEGGALLAREILEKGFAKLVDLRTSARASRTSTGDTGASGQAPNGGATP